MVSPRAIAAAAAVWVGLHLVLLIRSLEESSLPVLDVCAAAIAVAATGYALAPLLERPSLLLRSHALVLAAIYVAVAAAVTPTLSPAGFVGYANWWPGGLAPLLAALVLRRQALAALTAALGGTAALAVGAMLTQAPGDRLGPTVTLAFPLALWPLGALAFRAVFDRADEVVADLRWGAAQTLARARRGDAHDVAAARVLDHAVPLLEDRAAGGTPTNDDEGRARQVERAIRDEIRGGRLLDAATRAYVRSLRANGWHVAIDDYAAHDVAAHSEDEQGDALLVDLVHTTMLTCLEASEPGRLELTAPIDPVTRLTVLVRASGASLDAVTTSAKAVLDRHRSGDRNRRGGAHATTEPGTRSVPARFAWSLDIVRDEAAPISHVPFGPGDAPSGPSRPMHGASDQQMQLWIALSQLDQLSEPTQASVDRTVRPAVGRSPAGR